jgi:hypothetical protein
VYFTDDPAFKGVQRELVAQDFVYSITGPQTASSCSTPATGRETSAKSWKHQQVTGACLRGPCAASGPPVNPLRGKRDQTRHDAGQVHDANQYFRLQGSSMARAWDPTATTVHMPVLDESATSSDSNRNRSERRRLPSEKRSRLQRVRGSRLLRPFTWSPPSCVMRSLQSTFEAVSQRSTRLRVFHVS